MNMVIAGFQNAGIAILYIIAVGALGLHLMHGMQSSLQSLGLMSDSARPCITKTGTVAAWLLFAGYAVIPIVIIFGSIAR